MGARATQSLFGLNQLCAMNNRKVTGPMVQKRARELRAGMTRAEVLLWQKLRGDQMLGLRFRRQEPIGNFIADFFCAAARLVVELDGDSHDGRADYDATRDEILAAEGYRTLRFRNEDVFRNLSGVLETIESHCLPFAPTFAPTQPPPEGEELRD